MNFMNFNEFERLKTRIPESISHFRDIDKDISKLPQFIYNDKLIETLANCTLYHFFNNAQRSDSNHSLLHLLDIKFEFIIENQRGSTILGIPMYANQFLLQPLDPPRFQTLNGKALESVLMYPLPGTNWEWAWNEWHILMLNNVDENGWTYSGTSFGSKRWNSSRYLGKFVRRRIWLRMAERNFSTKVAADNSISEENIPSTINVFPFKNQEI